MAKVTIAKKSAAIIGALLTCSLGAGGIVEQASGANESLIAGNAPGVPVAAAPTQADKLLDAALEAIARQQEAVKNLTVSGELNEESLDQKTGTWEPQTQRKVTVTYDGADARKCQIACPLAKMPTPDGPVPFQTERYIVVYDGEVGLKLVEPDTGLWIAMCEITAGRPPEVDDTARATGLVYSVLGWEERSEGRDRKAKRLVDVIREARKLPGFHVQMVTEEGREYLEIIAPRGGPSESGDKVQNELHFWLLPAKNDALARVESYVTENGWKHKSWQMDATAFSEPVKGLFYPKTIELRSFGATRETESLVLRRTTVDISGAQINTAVSPDTFSIEKVELPTGTSNLRGSDGEVIRFTPDEQQRLFAQVARQVLAGAQKEKAVNSPGERTP